MHCLYFDLFLHLFENLIVMFNGQINDTEFIYMHVYVWMFIYCRYIRVIRMTLLAHVQVVHMLSTPDSMPS